MQTIVLNSQNNLEETINQSIEFLNRGEIIVFPTETVYGMGADFFNLYACKKIFKIKLREEKKPLSAHVSNLSMIKMICHPIPKEFYLLAKHFLPGPLSIILQKKKEIQNFPLTETIAIRFPKNDCALRLIEKFGKPIAATSVNKSGKKPLNLSEEILSEFNGKIAAILDDGPPAYSSESTVISLCSKPAKILRQGVFPKEAIEDVLKMDL